MKIINLTLIAALLLLLGVAMSGPKPNVKHARPAAPTSLQVHVNPALNAKAAPRHRRRPLSPSDAELLARYNLGYACEREHGGVSSCAVNRI